MYCQTCATKDSKTTNIEQLKILIFLGSVRDGRKADRVGKFIRDKLVEAKFSVEVLDPLELDIPLLKQPLHFYPDPSQAPQILKDINEKILNADAFVIITAEYNSQMPPALTNLMDHFPPKSYSYRPSAIVSYSPSAAGGSRAAAQCRSFTVELTCSPMPYVLSIAEVHKKLDEIGKPLDDYLHTQAKKLVDQLEWYASALKTHRAKVGTPQT